MAEQRRRLSGIGLVLMLHLVILGLAWSVQHTVVPGWVKGPLIDPAAPYAPENAQVLFAIGACVALDVYLLVLWVAGRRGWGRGRSLVVALALGFAGAEGTLQAIIAMRQVTYFRPHPTLHWVVRPDLDAFPNPTGGGLLSTNRFGMREVNVPQAKPIGEVRVLVLGDSSNFGHGVEGAQMWSAVLERLLQSHAPSDKRVVVINGATPGWTTTQGLEMLDLYGLGFQPDLVLAGFNNDSGPDYLGDRERAVPPGLARALSRWAFHSEAYLLTREVVLSLARRFGPGHRDYLSREGGSQPTYGRLESEALHLVPRVGRTELEDNLRALADKSADAGARFAWIDMPVNRMEPGLVQWFVDWDYRATAAAVSQEAGFAMIPVDARWMRSREPGLHIPGHVFHPSVQGHQRMGEQIAQVVFEDQLLPGLEGAVRIGGPPPATAPDTVRLGWSSRTPVHAHVGAVLAAHPELAAAHGIVIEDTSFASGKAQGAAVQDRMLDAFFSCEVPAVRMLAGRPDVRIVGSPGVLGRIAVVAPVGVERIEGLVGGRVGMVPGSTPAMDWEQWGKGLRATVVPLKTDGLYDALMSGEVDAIVGWDPWVEDWLGRASAQGKPLRVVEERPFHSVLAVSEGWALGGPDGADLAPRATRLVTLVEAALGVAAEDRETFDAAVARMSGWSVEVVRAVAERNPILAGKASEPGVLSAEATSGLERAARWDRSVPVDRMLGLPLLDGQPMGPAGPPDGSD